MRFGIRKTQKTSGILGLYFLAANRGYEERKFLRIINLHPYG
jgi:hypothetical protein